MPSPSRVLALALVLASVAAGVAAQYQSSPAAASAAPTESSLKKALAEGRAVIGATVTVPNVDTALTLANAGFDFLWIEMEHGPMTLESLRAILLATRGAKAVPITRVPANELWLAKRVLDEGSLGVIFPFTSTRELAERAVAACRYPPLGDRGFGPGFAMSRFGLGGAEYVKFANENVLVVVIVERKEAIENIESIASVAGVGGRTTDPLVEQALTKVLDAGRRHGIPVGYPTGNPEEINRRIAQGFRFFQASSDIGLMAGAARDMLSKVDRSAAPLQ